ncbi:glycosyltransferase family 4 protein [Nostoc sp. UCD121]|uniref:glycosyltransferase family 4 protein n=1 Tax=unclassified Nostoc TaxID=2593658 RepID=UPI00162A9F10|nr:MULTISPECIES: glycosyltransferase family 1 protein [unclassified Nostoc]MBC1224182.1 glycosyltransferase family 4 protein [Nostoc sp. UCD120]MBC1280908.1 glycosyltransferase family 4 protein [Nostoc sp. UCD121]MBC1299034.1 glycosyltransferase family 4 protein [Nostoc sp. UCD122]
MSSIVINARTLTQPLTGIQRYAYEVIKRFPRLKLVAPGQPISAFNDINLQHFLVVNQFLGGHLWEQLVLPTMISNKDLLWSPGGLGAICVSKQVLTIHDVASFEYPQWYSKKYTLLYNTVWPKLIPKLPRILTVSEFSKERISSILKVPKEKIFVTPHGIDTRFSPQSQEVIKDKLQRLGVNQPYILALSAISPRKNFQRLYEAWKILCSRLSDVWLVVVGEQGLAFSGKISQEEMPPRTLYLGRVDDMYLPALYSGALTFVYPSLYEGFGIPPLEAMACGTPVVTSNLTALPEVVGEAAIIINPYDIEEIAWGIQKIVESSTMQESLRIKGLKRVQSFTWEHTSTLTWKALQDIA